MKRYFNDGARIVVTGDSLSYNRYDYDPVHRLNAFDCFPDMGSWPFRLRDAALTEGGFEYARDLTDMKATSAPNRIFGERSVTFTDSAAFLFEPDTPRITLYLQCLPEGGCFDMYDNGRQVLTDVSFRGNIDTDVLFKRLPLGKWRYDNAHLTRFGSDMLYEYLMGL